MKTRGNTKGKRKGGYTRRESIRGGRPETIQKEKGKAAIQRHTSIEGTRGGRPETIRREMERRLYRWSRH